MFASVVVLMEQPPLLGAVGEVLVGKTTYLLFRVKPIRFLLVLGVLRVVLMAGQATLYLQILFLAEELLEEQEVLIQVTAAALAAIEGLPGKVAVLEDIPETEALVVLMALGAAAAAAVVGLT